MAKAKKAAGPKSPSERASERRADLIAKGWAQKNWLLPPPALAALREVVEREGCTEAEAVERAIVLLANERQPRLSNSQLLKLVRERMKGD